ncbi:30S ribosome-binding factor RbfA [Mesomycoplasma neurolyticum]|uniref:Ribosome-binding factor A n=1 Tax=Mesomycoplasma neurolyticum TaxID=2120 RepID=A0A449A6F5_9BACT|nr:30S ribosome-binding factor RbfA [Mesomycoplasma neurolyticum]VEU59824.1 ribosome-binding factor A [Mesomycoplasma neurolyticum]
MSSISIRKKESHYHLILSQIFQEEFQHSDVIGLTITEVRLSNDGSHLKVYLSFEQREKKGLIAVDNAKAFIRRELAHRINARRVPELHFFIDEVAEYANKIENILQQIKEKENK